MAKLKREMIFRWRCQWAIITIAAVGVFLYNTAANIWLMQLTPCRVQITTAPSEMPTCEACTETVQNVAVDDDPISKLDIRLGRWDTSRTYKLFDYASVGDNYANLSSKRKVCLATQTSIERLHEIMKLAAHWTAPISLAVFVTGEELALLRGFTIWLFKCHPEIYARLAIHVATHSGRPGSFQEGVPDWARDCESIPLPPGLRRSDTVVWKMRNAYPQNHMRNLARKNCHTPYVFLVDVDIVPSKGMSEGLDAYLETAPKCALCAFVVPTYELDKRVVNFPANKTEILRLSRGKLAIPFHRKVFIYNQYASNFTRWEASGGNESSEIHISHSVTNFELLYEPFYIAPDTVPAHDERFIGYGFTRNTQVYEMFLIGYQFKVLSPIFTIHWGLQARRTRPPWREKQNSKNRKLFEGFKRELFAKYRKDPLHLLKKPTPPKKT